MMSLVDIESAWTVLGQPDSQDSAIRVRELDELTTATGHPLFAVGTNGHRHLLIPVGDITEVHTDKRSAGVHLATLQLMDRNVLRSFADLECRKPHLNTLFSIILSEVLQLLETTSSHSDLVCHQVLDRWRELLEREPSGRPSLTVLTGLFGELWYVRDIVRRGGSVACWVGPDGARHDFSAPQIALEVKTSLTRHGRFFTIHGMEQLQPPEKGELFLAAVTLEQLASGGETLSSLVADITQAGGDRFSLLTLLSKVGLTPDMIDLCSDTSFRVLENRIYAVEGDFPRIVSDHFKAGHLPIGVLTVNYEIDLSTEPPIPVSEAAASEACQLLASRSHL